MNFDYSLKVLALRARVDAFMQDHIFPAERAYLAEVDAHRRAGNPWVVSQVMEDLKSRARDAGLWNLFLPQSARGGGLTNLEYGAVCELMGRSLLAPEAFNCSAPDTGNMEILERYGTAEHKRRWLEPLLAGEIRSAFAMTEPQVASSDATNIDSRIVRDGSGYIVNGRKWWTTGAMDPRCRVLIVMGKSDPEHPDAHRRHSMILVPMEAPGVRVLRHLTVFGYDDAPHGHAEIVFENVRVPLEHLLLGEGRGFEAAQARLGPGRMHHCMRTIGLAERALTLMCQRAAGRVAFGRTVAERSVTLERIATARVRIDQARLLVLSAASMMDTVGNKAAARPIAMAKVAVPEMACEILDWAIQAHGGAGVSDDVPLAAAYAHARTLRILDGPDEVHRQQIGRLELAAQLQGKGARTLNIS